MRSPPCLARFGRAAPMAGFVGLPEGANPARQLVAPATGARILNSAEELEQLLIVGLR